MNGPKTLRAKLRELGITHSKFARMIGVENGVITHWLAGDRRPGLANALKLEVAVGIPAKAWLEKRDSVMLRKMSEFRYLLRDSCDEPKRVGR